MRLITAILTTTALISLFGCLRNVRVAPTPTIITTTNRYRIAQETEDKFIIHAIDTRSATEAANEELGCKRRVCILQPGGVILFVDRITPRKEKKETPEP